MRTFTKRYAVLQAERQAEKPDSWLTEITKGILTVVILLSVLGLVVMFA